MNKEQLDSFAALLSQQRHHFLQEFRRAEQCNSLRISVLSCVEISRGSTIVAYSTDTESLPRVS